MADFYLKKNDTGPALVATLADSEGNAVSLSGATARFHMRVRGAAALTTDAAATVDPDQVTNKGKVTYSWAAADTDVAGEFEGEFQVTFGGGVIETFPNRKNLAILITDELG